MSRPLVISAPSCPAASWSRQIVLSRMLVVVHRHMGKMNLNPTIKDESFILLFSRNQPYSLDFIASCQLKIVFALPVLIFQISYLVYIRRNVMSAAAGKERYFHEDQRCPRLWI